MQSFCMRRLDSFPKAQVEAENVLLSGLQEKKQSPSKSMGRNFHFTIVMSPSRTFLPPFSHA